MEIDGENMSKNSWGKIGAENGRGNIYRKELGKMEKKIDG